MNRRRILQLVGSFELGGSELQAVNLSKRIVDEGTYEVHVACLDRKGPLLDRIDWMPLREVPSFPLSSFYDLNFLRQSRSLAKYIKQNRIEVIHTHDFYTNIFGMLSAASCGLSARIASKRETQSKSALQFFAERQAFRLAKAIVVNSEAVRLYLTAHGVSGDKIEKVYNGIDRSRFDRLKTIDREVQSRAIPLQLNKHARVVTIVANMRSEVKDHRMFLRAAKKVTEKFADAVFVLAGEGELREDLKNFAARLGIRENCHFVGSGVNIPSLLLLSNVGVLCSRSEGFSNAILEYMAAGLPVVATDVGGAREAVRHNETGFLIGAEDVDALTGAIIKLLGNENLSREFGRRGREIAYRDFSSERQVEAVLSLYDSVLSSR